MRYHAFSPGRSLPPLTLLLLALAGCSGDIKLAAGEILHPTPENAPPADASLITTDTVPAGLTEDALSAWRAARDRLLNATTVLSLGRDDNEAPELFGMISDVAFDAEGNILVADEADYSVRTFGPEGSHVATFGREGEGPMEFSSRPHSIGALADGRILVGTRVSTKIFGPAPDGYRHLETVSVYSDDFCLSADERMFTAIHDTRKSERVLHEVDQAGDSILRNFGHGYLDDEWLFRNQLSDGEIACLDDPLRLVFVFNEHPMVRVHHPGEDEPLWTATFEDYLQSHYIGTTRESGGPSIRSVKRDGEVAVNPHALSPDHIVVQTLRFYFLTFSIRVRTYLLDAATGYGALISDDLPQIREIAGGRIVVAWDDPYPRLEVRELAEAPGR